MIPPHLVASALSPDAYAVTDISSVSVYRSVANQGPSPRWWAVAARLVSASPLPQDVLVNENTTGGQRGGFGLTVVDVGGQARLQAFIYSANNANARTVTSSLALAPDPDLVRVFFGAFDPGGRVRVAVDLGDEELSASTFPAFVAAGSRDVAVGCSSTQADVAVGVEFVSVAMGSVSPSNAERRAWALASARAGRLLPMPAGLSTVWNARSHAQGSLPLWSPEFLGFSDFDLTYKSGESDNASILRTGVRKSPSLWAVLA